MPLQLGRDFRTSIKPAQNVDLQCSLWSLSTQPLRACPTSTLHSYASPKFFQRSRQGGKISMVPLFLGLHNKCRASQSLFVRPGFKTTKHPTLMEGGMARCGCPHPYSQHLGNWGRRIMSLKSAWLHREYETWPEETSKQFSFGFWHVPAKHCLLGYTEGHGLHWAPILTDQQDRITQVEILHHQTKT